MYGVKPDIVTIGKGLGNGFPLAAVVCTREVANSLDEESRELFSTFGGNPVACAAGLAVLEYIDDNSLMNNAYVVGAELKSRLLEMKSEKIVCVRGEGLFVGIELSSSIVAGTLLRELKSKHKIIASLDGPADNVMVVKPPLTWTLDEVFYFCEAVREVLINM